MPSRTLKLLAEILDNLEEIEGLIVDPILVDKTQELLDETLEKWINIDSDALDDPAYVIIDDLAENLNSYYEDKVNFLDRKVRKAIHGIKSKINSEEENDNSDEDDLAFLEKLYSSKQLSKKVAENKYVKSESYSLSLPHKLISGNRLYTIINIIPFIMEHMQRKIELFFYLLVAYYNTGFEVALGETKGQFGCGNKEYGTEASHSALLSSLTDNGKGGKSVEGYHTRSKGTVIDKDCLYKNTFFFKVSLDSTVELPTVVNDFDGKLEGTTGNPSQLRKDSLQIVNTVSKGEKSPLEGLDDFIVTLCNYLNSSTIQEYLKACNIESLSIIRIIIYETWMTSIYRITNDEGGVDINYLYLLLRIFPTVNTKITQTKIDAAYEAIGQEIRNTNVKIVATKEGTNIQPPPQSSQDIVSHSQYKI